MLIISRRRGRSKLILRLFEMLEWAVSALVVPFGLCCLCGEFHGALIDRGCKAVNRQVEGECMDMYQRLVINY